MQKLPSRSSRLIATMHRVVLTKLDADLKGQLHVRLIMRAIVTRVFMGFFSIHQRFAKLKSKATHPPHVLVSAKVLLQSRRAKGGFSFGRKVLHG
jgi:hypothetical protein